MEPAIRVKGDSTLLTNISNINRIDELYTTLILKIYA